MGELIAWLIAEFLNLLGIEYFKKEDKERNKKEINSSKDSKDSNGNNEKINL